MRPTRIQKRPGPKAIPIPRRIAHFIPKVPIQAYIPHRGRGPRLAQADVGPLHRASVKLKRLHERYMSMASAQMAQMKQRQEQIRDNHPQFHGLNRAEKKRLITELEERIHEIGQEKGRFDKKHERLDDLIDQEALNRLRW
ncbi:MAG: hypothetical protein Q7R47_06850, partial [Candidatus Diapherotrites archaeon]|nr:hypothetical protein [Candidatus Diapherotrites archaeon]